MAVFGTICIYFEVPLVHVVRLSTVTLNLAGDTGCKCAISTLCACRMQTRTIFFLLLFYRMCYPTKFSTRTATYRSKRGTSNITQCCVYFAAPHGLFGLYHISLLCRYFFLKINSTRGTTCTQQDRYRTTRTHAAPHACIMMHTVASLQSS